MRWFCINLQSYTRFDGLLQLKDLKNLLKFARHYASELRKINDFREYNHFLLCFHV